MNLHTGGKGLIDPKVFAFTRPFHAGFMSCELIIKSGNNVAYVRHVQNCDLILFFI